MDVFANHRAYWKTGISVILMLAASVPASAQSDQQKTRVFTLEEAVDFALKNYPAVRVSLERLRSAEAGVTVARTSYLPRTDVLWQSNRATDNNITGLTLPNSVIAPITEPVPLATSNRSAWGSAGGLLFSWEPLDFGYRGARVDAALARARVNLARAQQQEATSRAQLADILGIADVAVEVRESTLLGTPPAAAPPPTAISANPAAEVQRARVQESQSLVHALDRSYYPKLYLQSVVMGRGSGVDPTGNFLGGTEGLGPDRANWAAGLMVTFPVFDIFSIKFKKAAEAANERAEEARYDQALQDLTGQLRKAQASLDGARKVAENTPLELDAARTTETQERARYQAGLATLVDVADSQSLLVQAEIDDALARLAVWQNLAAVAAAQGDLGPFLQSLHAAQGEK